MPRTALIKEPIQEVYTQFQEVYNKALESSNPILAHLIQHVYNASGKHMRPLLVLLSGELCGGVTNETLHAAASLELLHLATLIHDDVVDEANTRRGKPSVRAIFDNKISVLGGDFILSTALCETAKTKNNEAVELIANLGKQLSNGEILQLHNSKDKIYKEDSYFEVIHNKTAVLFITCCRLGAILSPNYDKYKDTIIAEIGRLIGLCFQLRDDIFDYNTDSAIGKPTGIDILEGKMTLPLLYIYENSDNNMRTRIQDAMENQEVAFLQNLAHSNGGIEYAYNKLDEMKNNALELLKNNFEPSSIREALEQYILYVADRTI